MKTKDIKVGDLYELLWEDYGQVKRVVGKVTAKNAPRFVTGSPRAYRRTVKNDGIEVELVRADGTNYSLDRMAPLVSYTKGTTIQRPLSLEEVKPGSGTSYRDTHVVDDKRYRVTGYDESNDRLVVMPRVIVGEWNDEVAKQRYLDVKAAQKREAEKKARHRELMARRARVVAELHERLGDDHYFGHKSYQLELSVTALEKLLGITE